MKKMPLGIHVGFIELFLWVCVREGEKVLYLLSFLAVSCTKLILLSELFIAFWRRFYTGIDRNIVNKNGGRFFNVSNKHTYTRCIHQTQKVFLSPYNSHFTISLFFFLFLAHSKFVQHFHYCQNPFIRLKRSFELLLLMISNEQEYWFRHVMWACVRRWHR